MNRQNVVTKVKNVIVISTIVSAAWSVPTQAATLQQTNDFVCEVEHALRDGREGALIQSDTFFYTADVYDLMEYTCKSVDAPEVFLDNQCYVSYSMITRGDGSGYCLSAKIERYEKCNDLDADAIVADLNLEGHSDLEIAIIVHDWLTTSLTYGASRESLSECLTYGYGKCDDYSMIYATVMNAAGVETRCMDGVPNGSSSGHMWNMVQIEGNWYLCDVTNDDMDGNYSHFMKAMYSTVVRNYLGDYLDGYRLCNGVDEFLSYQMAGKNYSMRKIMKVIAKIS